MRSLRRFIRNNYAGPRAISFLVGTLISLALIASAAYFTYEHLAIEDRVQADFMNGYIKTFEEKEKQVREKQQELGSSISIISLLTAMFALTYSSLLVKAQHATVVSFLVSQSRTKKNKKFYAITLCNEGELSVIVRGVYLYDDNKHISSIELNAKHEAVTLESMETVTVELNSKQSSAYEANPKNIDIILDLHSGKSYAIRAKRKLSIEGNKLVEVG
ncbi:hypothetical protein AB4356_09640 [Vibrio lentus]